METVSDEMKLQGVAMATYQDEFDVYFVRAKLDENLAQEQAAMNQMSRRSSMHTAAGKGGVEPSPSTSSNFMDVPSHHRRAVSCKLPSTSSRRRRSRSKGSKSPKNGSPPGERRDSQVPALSDDASEPLLNGTNVTREHQTGLELSMNYIRETTLRAPSPRVGGSTPKSHSAPHSRSSSWKTKSRPNSLRHGDGAKTKQQASDSSPPKSGERSREGSEHFEDEVARKLEELRLLQSEDVCIVRNFETSTKGRLINRGDSFKRRPQHQPVCNSVSNSSMPAGSISSDVGVAFGRQQSVASESSGHNISSIKENVMTSHINKILVTGDHGVGKTALLQQFMTSDYMAAMETYDEDFDKMVTVTVDGAETVMDFIEVAPESDLSKVGEVDGYLLICSITSRQSYNVLKNIIEHLPPNRHQAAIVVANKSDLVRQRAVGENELRLLCAKHNCKYTEVSAAINHKVDNLLVGLVHQVRLNPDRQEVRNQRFENHETNEKTVMCSTARGLMQMFFGRKRTVSRSCDNLSAL